MHASFITRLLRPNLLIVAAATTACLGMSTAQAEAQSTTLENSDTTWLRELPNPDQNWGGAGRVRTQSPLQNTEMILTKFPDLAANVGDNQSVQSATLRLYKYAQAQDQTTSTTVDAHRVLQSWAEGSGTGDPVTTSGTSYNWRDELAGNRWQGGGALELGEDVVEQATDEATIDGSEGETGYQEWDVTADVQQYLDGTADNHGWLLHEIGPNMGPFFLSDESNNNAPQLVLQTTNSRQSIATNPEPSTAAMLAVGGVTLVLRRRRGANKGGR